MSSQGHLFGKVCSSIRSFLRPSSLSNSGLAHAVDAASARSLCVGGLRFYSDGSARRNPLMDGLTEDDGEQESAAGEAGDSDGREIYVYIYMCVCCPTERAE